MIGYKSRLDPAQEPLEDRILAGVDATLRRYGYNETHRPSETYRQRLMHEQTLKEQDATDGLPWTFKKPKRRWGR